MGRLGSGPGVNPGSTASTRVHMGISEAAGKEGPLGSGVADPAEGPCEKLSRVRSIPEWWDRKAFSDRLQACLAGEDREDQGLASATVLLLILARTRMSRAGCRGCAILPLPRNRNAEPKKDRIHVLTRDVREPSKAVGVPIRS